MTEERLQLLNVGLGVCRTGYILAHESQIREPHSIFAIDVVRKSDVDKKYIKKQKIIEVFGKLTRMRGISTECQIHNAITSEKERILKVLGYEI